jgi:heme-degrading monooxygenase HmoA
VLALTRCAVPADSQDGFLTVARGVLGLLAGRPGFVRGHLGRAVDRTDLWVLSTEWSGVGHYRRGLSAYDVKVAIAPLMPYVVDEPGAFEVAQTWTSTGGG